MVEEFNGMEVFVSSMKRFVKRKEIVVDRKWH